MNLKSNNKVDTNTYELEISINAEEFEAAVQKAYLKSKNKVTVPGFRKGKAPRKIIERMYGETAFYEDAVNELIPDETEKAVEEAKLHLVAAPKIDVTSVKKEDGVEYKATCTVYPEVKVKDYKGIEVEKKIKEVTEDDINAKLDAMRNKNSRMVTVEDREAKNGDTTNINFKGLINDVEFEGGKAENFNLVLGSGQFIPGFEDQVAGHKAGDEFDVNVTFPENYQMAEIAGKPAVFKVKINEIQVKELPELDDEFVKDTTEFETLAELKEDIKKKLVEQYTKQADIDLENLIFDKIIENTEVELPRVMIDTRIDQMVEETQQQMKMQGINMEMYFQYTGTTMEEFRKTFDERATKEVKLRAALQEIVNMENIEATAEDIADGYKKLAESYGVKEEQVKAAIPEVNIAEDAKVGKAADLVKEAAIIK